MSVAWETRTSSVERRQISKCRRCKSAHSIEVHITSERTHRSDSIKCVTERRTVALLDGTPAPAGRVCCGSSWDYRSIVGVRNDAVKCNARCQESKGFQCECSCAGKNHGKAHG